MSVDPLNITNYNLINPQLEEHLLFWICAAGKNGVTAAKCLEKLLTGLRFNYCDGRFGLSAFEKVRKVPYGHNLSSAMKAAGIGCYNSKSVTFLELAHSGLDLKKCSVDDLEAIKGIGNKTSRCFIMHSRPNQRLAGLDVHILKFLRDKGYSVSKSTPSGKRYKTIEQYFLKEADNSGLSVADFDLKVWKEYRAR